MKKITAIVFGASGLTGSHLVKLLLEDDHYSKVKIFVRKPISFPESKKAEISMIDFSCLDKQEQIVFPASENSGTQNGADVFCCLGTTLAKAGSKAAFRTVDHELPVALAAMASAHHADSFIVVSSIGANDKSSSFYLRTKGEMERDVSQFPFRKIAIMRPSFILGERKESRFGEEMGKVLSLLLNPALIGPLRKYRSILALDIAIAMIKIANGNFPGNVFESDKIQEIADSITP